MHYLMKELIAYYFNDENVNIEAVPFGLTNYSKVFTINNTKYIARIYDEYSKDLEKLKFEIKLTTFLEQQNLSFKVPEFLIAHTGGKYVELSNGQFGSVMNFIEGEIPDLTQMLDIKEYGRVVSELSVAFKAFKRDVHGQQIKFYNIYNLHPLSNEKSINNFLNQMPFEIEDSQLSILKKSILDVKRIESIAEDLPKQIIHHDILVFNLLIDSKTRKMNGVLDFDFASHDIRALELAICINHILQFSDSSFVNLELFLDEYFQYVTLTIEEINNIPMLMKMYYVALICIYIGQYYSGLKIDEYFRVILNQLIIRTQWIEKNEEALLECIKIKLS